MLPIEAEPQAMVALLPHETLGQLDSGWPPEDVARVSEREPDVGDDDARRAQAETAGDSPPRSRTDWRFGKKYENRKSFTSAVDNTLVSATRP